MDHRVEGAVNGLLHTEAGPGEGAVCASCDTSLVDVKVYCCYQCIMPPLLCKECLMTSHTHNPFHFVRIWDPARRFWERRPLSELGVVFEFGHEGKRCHLSSQEPRPMTIVSEEGVHVVKVRFCACKDNVTNLATPEATQLVKNGFWPASWMQPRTACTIQVMKTFLQLSSLAHANGKDYFQVLRHKTDSIAPHQVEVCERDHL